MAAQQKLLIDHFKQLGATVTRQEFTARNPLTGDPVPMTNLLIQWHPERKERVLLVAHYDTRPFPDRDPHNPRGTFLGANDGASGVAILMELGKSMPQFKSPSASIFCWWMARNWSIATDYYLGRRPVLPGLGRVCQAVFCRAAAV